MAEEPQPPQEKKQPTPHHIPETIIAVWNWVWGFFELQSVGDDVKEQAPLIRKRVSVLIVLFLVGLAGWALKEYLDEERIDNAITQSQNSAASAQTYKAQLDAADNTIIQVKVDANEAARKADAEVEQITADKNAALQRISQLESLPSTAADMYLSASNIIKSTLDSVSNVDEKTSDLISLPDGRTMFGGLLTGTPKVLLAAFDSGEEDLKDNDPNGALASFLKADALIEGAPPSPVLWDTSSSISPYGKTMSYYYTAVSAQRMRSNDIANKYAEKAVNQLVNIQTKELYTTTLANMAFEAGLRNDVTNTFVFLSKAIANYESTDYGTNHPGIDAGRIYFIGAFAALSLGKTNTASGWAMKSRNFASTIVMPSNIFQKKSK